MNDQKIERAYKQAREKFKEMGSDTEKALEQLKKVSLSIHCWQGDDVAGFERPDTELKGGGLQVTGNYPGQARTIGELRQDLEKVYSLLPGNHRLNLHAIYGEFKGKSIDRDQIEPHHFKGWIDWAKDQGVELDFNCTCFSHPLADSGYTLSSKDEDIRCFWVEHVDRCRQIGAFMGREGKSPCVHNIWVPDGSKDMPMDRKGHRDLLRKSLDEIFSTEYPAEELKDSLESKLFGIGSESYVVGSHEFYMGYALSNQKMICLDTGHFHPTENIGDKISAVLQFSDELLLHVSRGVRWDSDHIVVLDDGIRSLFEEVVRGEYLNQVHLALDFFDASLNRVGAWIIGARAVLKAILAALLEPRERLLQAENEGDYFTRLALLEELKAMPLGAVWDYFCSVMEVHAGPDWMKEILRYDRNVTRKRG
ncbi:MAG: L-rhamnose isomerase [Candidatus Aminicenantes bacterium]|nr:L-rhamnose isomerase [Candidatus Aminicenantes bacterium]